MEQIHTILGKLTAIHNALMKFGSRVVGWLLISVIVKMVMVLANYIANNTQN